MDRTYLLIQSVLLLRGPLSCLTPPAAQGEAQPFRVGFSSSPKIIPTLICFRADYAPAFKDKILAGLRDLHLSPAGQQVLTVFRCEKLEEIPADGLQSTLDFLAYCDRLKEAGPSACQSLHDETTGKYGGCYRDGIGSRCAKWLNPRRRSETARYRNIGCLPKLVL